MIRPVVLQLMLFIALSTPVASEAWAESDNTSASLSSTNLQQSTAPLPAFCANVPPPSQSLAGATSYTYRVIGERSLRIHVFEPEHATRSSPTALFFFGGGFRVGDVANVADLAKAFTAHGYVTALADYRVLCRDHVTAVAGVEDAEATLVWLDDHARELGINPKTIVLIGGSAGGFLATSAALRVSDRLRPAALVLFNPVLDLETGIWAHDQSAAAALAYSPSRLPLTNVPPVVIFHGTADHTVPIHSSRDFCTRVLSIGRICQLNEYEGKDHSFADQHDIDPVLGTSMFDDTVSRAFLFLDPIMKLQR